MSITKIVNNPKKEEMVDEFNIIDNDKKDDIVDTVNSINFPTKIWRESNKNNILEPGTVVKHNNYPCVIIKAHKSYNDNEYVYDIRQLVKTNKIYYSIPHKNLIPFKDLPNLWNGTDEIKQGMILDCNDNKNVWRAAIVNEIVQNVYEPNIITYYTVKFLFEVISDSNKVIHNNILYDTFAVYGSYSDISKQVTKTSQFCSTELQIYSPKRGDIVEFKSPKFQSIWLFGTVLSTLVFDQQTLFIHIKEHTTGISCWVENIQYDMINNNPTNIRIVSINPLFKFFSTYYDIVTIMLALLIIVFLSVCYISYSDTCKLQTSFNDEISIVRNLNSDTTNSLVDTIYYGNIRVILVSIIINIFISLTMVFCFKK